MNINELKGKELEEIKQAFDDELNTYKEKVNSINTIDDIDKEEEELMNDAKKYDEYLNDVSYTLQDKIDFENKTYNKSDVSKMILYALNKVEVPWESTLGMYELYNIWKNKEITSIGHKIFDSTIRILGQMIKYKGYDEWSNMLIINKYLSLCHHDYIIDTQYNVLISEKHNCLLDRRKLLEKPNQIVNESDVVEM